jgi:hypothetical protein
MNNIGFLSTYTIIDDITQYQDFGKVLRLRRYIGYLRVPTSILYLSVLY